MPLTGRSCQWMDGLLAAEGAEVKIHDTLRWRRQQDADKGFPVLRLRRNP